MEENMHEMAWKPYPEMTEEEELAFGITDSELYGLSADKKTAVNKIRSDYVGKLIMHRVYLGADYDRLKEIRRKAITAGDKGRQKRCEQLILEHRSREQNVDTMTSNVVFRGRRYCKGGSVTVTRPFQQRVPKEYANHREEVYA